MSRKKLFIQGVATGQLLLGMLTLYTLVGIGLAARTLAADEFGVWNLVLSIGLLLGSLDLGTGASVTRQLIDYKHRSDDDYRTFLRHGVWLFLILGLFVAGLGTGIAFSLAELPRIPLLLRDTFRDLLIAQTLLCSLGLFSRVFSQVLQAHQRMDLVNWAGIAHYGTALLVLCLALSWGWGVWSLILSQAVGWIVATALQGWLCLRGGYFRRGTAGPLQWSLFRQVLGYGLEVFWIGFSTQFIVLGSQTILLTAFHPFALQASALWGIATRAFKFTGDFIWRMIGVSMPGLSEILVDGDTPRLEQVYRRLFIAVSTLSVVGAVGLATCNQAFVHAWTKGRYSWDPAHDVLLGIWLVALTLVCAHNSLLLVLKELRVLKYFYALEALVSVGVSSLVVKRWGIAGMLSVFLVSTLLCNASYGISRLARWSVLFAGWRPYLPMFLLAAILIPVGWAVHWVTRHWVLNWMTFATQATIVGTVGALALVWVWKREGIELRSFIK